MKYLCLCYYDIKKFEAIDEKMGAELARICAPHDKALRDSGHLSMVGSLGEPHEARSIIPSTSGPQKRTGLYQNLPEAIGAFFIIEAGNIEDAAEIASLHPSAHVFKQLGGGIEVRSIEFMTEEERETD